MVCSDSDDSELDWSSSVIVLISLFIICLDFSAINFEFFFNLILAILAICASV